jgi:ribonuclease P protein component
MNNYPRELRLLSSGDFQQVFDDVEIKIPDQRILILSRANGLDHPRIGFIISKKNIRRAVKRNLVRRIIRESFRLNQNNLPAQDMIIMVRKGADEVSNENLHKLAKKCWSRLNKKVKQANSVK